MTITRSAITTIIVAGLAATVATAIPASAAIDSRLISSLIATGYNISPGNHELIPATVGANKAELTQIATRRTPKRRRINTAAPGRSGLARRHQKSIRQVKPATNTGQAALDCSIQSHPDCQPSGSGTTEHFFTIELGN